MDAKVVRAGWVVVLEARVVDVVVTAANCRAMKHEQLRKAFTCTRTTKTRVANKDVDAILIG